MKRIIPVFMIVLLVLGWGCGGTGGNDDKKDVSVTIEIPPGWEERKAEAEEPTRKPCMQHSCLNKSALVSKRARLSFFMEQMFRQ